MLFRLKFLFVRCKDGEVVATISAGYADGYNRLLSNNGSVTSNSGTLAVCEIFR